MPIPTVAGQPRCLQAEDRPHRAFTELGNQRLKPGALDHAAGGTPLILVDEHDVSESQRACLRDKRVLAVGFSASGSIICRGERDGVFTTDFPFAHGGMGRPLIEAQVLEETLQLFERFDTDDWRTQLYGSTGL